MGVLHSMAALRRPSTTLAVVVWFVTTGYSLSACAQEPDADTTKSDLSAENGESSAPVVFEEFSDQPVSISEDSGSVFVTAAAEEEVVIYVNDFRNQTTGESVPATWSRWPQGDGPDQSGGFAAKAKETMILLGKGEFQSPGTYFTIVSAGSSKKVFRIIREEAQTDNSESTAPVVFEEFSDQPVSISEDSGSVFVTAVTEEEVVIDVNDFINEMTSESVPVTWSRWPQGDGPDQSGGFAAKAKETVILLGKGEFQSAGTYFTVVSAGSSNKGFSDK